MAVLRGLRYQIASTEFESNRSAMLTRAVLRGQGAVADSSRGLSIIGVPMLPSVSSRALLAVLFLFTLACQGPGGVLGGLESFVLGAYSRLVSDSFIYPGRRAKVQKQVLSSAKDEESIAMSKMGAVTLCIHIVKTQGFGGLYRGLPTELFRGVLSGALLLLVKERLDLIANRILLSR